MSPARRFRTLLVVIVKLRMALALVWQFLEFAYQASNFLHGEQGEGETYTVANSARRTVWEVRATSVGVEMIEQIRFCEPSEHDFLYEWGRRAQGVWKLVSRRR